MRIRFGKKFHTTGIGKLFETVDYFRNIHFKLFKCNTRNRKTHFECCAILFNQIKQNLICW